MAGKDPEYFQTIQGKQEAAIVKQSRRWLRPLFKMLRTKVRFAASLWARGCCSSLRRGMDCDALCFVLFCLLACLLASRIGFSGVVRVGYHSLSHLWRYVCGAWEDRRLRRTRCCIWARSPIRCGRRNMCRPTIGTCAWLSVRIFFLLLSRLGVCCISVHIYLCVYRLVLSQVSVLTRAIVG